MAKSRKVEIQKGPLDCNLPTQSHMPYEEKVKIARAEHAFRRTGQDLHLLEPKTGRK